MEIKIIQETKIVGFLVLCPGDQYAKKLTPIFTSEPLLQEKPYHNK